MMRMETPGWCDSGCFVRGLNLAQPTCWNAWFGGVGVFFLPAT
jgi:hypothetical protein